MYRNCCAILWHGTWGRVHDSLKLHATQEGHKAATLASGRLLQRLPQRLLNECAAAAAGDIRPLANAGVSKGSDEAVAELAASVADEAVAELADDKSLLKGRVPQVDGWVDVWAESTGQLVF